MPGPRAPRPPASAAASASAVVLVVHHRRRGGFVHRVVGVSPDDDRDAALAMLLLGRQRVDAVLPADVHVAPEAEEAAVHLRKVRQRAGASVQKRQLPRRAEAHADRNVLILRPLGIERGRVVVEGLPITRVPVPGKQSGAKPNEPP
eukprot:scaffold325_cov230-Pinguiococcus_pyrenoidosus.AAC.3